MLTVEPSTVILAIWNLLVSAFLGLAMFNLRGFTSEQKRIDILLNKTREEIARDNVTRAEVERIADHIDQRFNRLEAKLDMLITQRMGHEA